ncbi:hypothetical protein BN996_01551 [Haloferax massiliensis]|uniref:Uncharacterized protein n=1 Tax=Haloferax massiliensis TaxID=1476858 RepID=A0A0D6JQE0_9EURY|nr:hypothetical protein BN996_01551 [Haloferax massiliensis]
MFILTRVIWFNDTIRECEWTIFSKWSFKFYNV